jgi:hypothetical protein
MFWPFRTRTIFRNRWWTLAWAATIIWGVYQFGSEKAEPSADVAALSASDAANQAQMAADLMNTVSSAQ